MALQAKSNNASTGKRCGPVIQAIHLQPWQMWHCQAALLLQAENSKDAKEIAAILAEENVQLVPEEEKDKLQELDSLTGQPRATDVLLYAIPVRLSNAKLHPDKN